MGKLAVFMAMKRDLAFEFERELRAVRNLILGVTRISGTDYTIDLQATEGFVAGSRARAAFAEALHSAVHEALLKYAHDLARESLEHGMDQDIVGGALGGNPALQTLQALRARAAEPQQPAQPADGNTVRLAVCA
ncbi:MAG: hypothetical protein JNN24_13920 [Hyphomicrobium zavarzinii]|jgi:hypothetical protein|uniref:hypothetical protein n=1 Tax=Hyphomicrobium TaxID=81 RepID=UPI00036E19A2|nr:MULTISPECIES: hypothetical protein [Hyphomicrobium]MBL8846861.1 hypothetical protein [Hyphomicrobium zavarzinii]WBT38123.1 hypothetical protein PE058_21095 [Hyphomicrobium sp. DMF-1]HML42490.1 hypothetical protein [Hyphomicrobium zavarzinii]